MTMETTVYKFLYADGRCTKILEDKRTHTIFVCIHQVSAASTVDVCETTFKKNHHD